MSKRNRGRRVTRPVQKQPEKQPEKKSHLIVPLLATDGYINRLAYLGEASLLQEGSDYERHSITRDYELLTVMYRENWIAKRIIDTPCEDMTRSWYSISSALNQDRIDEIVQLESKHNIKQEITNGLRWARLFGGSAAVMVIKGQEDMLDQPLNYDEMMPGCFRGLIVVDRTSGLDPSVELEEDMDDPEFGYPKWYTVRLDNESTMRVHHSRMLLFRGRMLPIQEEISESFWGASELEHVYEELQKRNATSANIAQLVFQANVGVLKMADYGEIMGMGTEAQREQIVNAIYDQNRIRNSFGMMIMGNDDGYEQHPYSFSGLSEVYESFMMDMAGAAEIPATKLYGRSPQGMNATGESDMKNYYEMLAQLQERNLRPAIDKLLPVMCMSLWGKIPNDLDIVFEPLQITTPAERAQITSQVTGVVIQAFSAGLISQQTALEELQKAGKDIGSWTSITDELIENAESEVDQGEGMQDPMGGMGGGMPGMPGMPGAPGGEGGEEAPPEAGGMPGGEEAGMMPPGAEGQEEQPQEAPDEPEPSPESQEDRVIAKLKKAVQGGSEAEEQGASEEPDEEAQDGGPGSGPKPGYHKNGPHKMEEKASLGQRFRFMQDPTEGKNVSERHYGPTGSKTAVARNNSERSQWSDLTMRQRIKGSAEQERHMAGVRNQVMKAAAKGDLETARKLVRENKHYFHNDPTSAMKVQSETLKRQKAVKPVGPIREKLASVFHRSGHDEEAWRTNEEGRHFKLETSTGEIKAGFGGKFNGKKVGEQWESGSGSKPRVKGSKVAAPPKAPVPKGKSVPVSFNNVGSGAQWEKNLDAKRAQKQFSESKENAESVFKNGSSSAEDMEDALGRLSVAAEKSDAWKKAKNGEIPTADEYGMGNVPREWAERLTEPEKEALANMTAEIRELPAYLSIVEWAEKNPEADKAMMTLQAKLMGAEIDARISDDIMQKYAGVERREEIPGQQSMFWGENVPGSALGMREESATDYTSKDSGYVPYDDLSTSHRAVFEKYKEDFAGGKSVLKKEKANEHFPGSKEFAERKKKADQGRTSYPSEFGISQDEVNKMLSDAIKNNAALYRFNGDGTLRIIVKSDRIIGKCVSAKNPKGTDTRWFMSTVKRSPGGWEHHEYPCREEGHDGSV